MEQDVKREAVNILLAFPSASTARFEDAFKKLLSNIDGMTVSNYYLCSTKDDMLSHLKKGYLDIVIFIDKLDNGEKIGAGTLKQLVGQFPNVKFCMMVKKADPSTPNKLARLFTAGYHDVVFSTDIKRESLRKVLVLGRSEVEAFDYYELLELFKDENTPEDVKGSLLPYVQRYYPSEIETEVEEEDDGFGFDDELGVGEDETEDGFISLGGDRGLELSEGYEVEESLEVGGFEDGFSDSLEDEPVSNDDEVGDGFSDGVLEDEESADISVMEEAFTPVTEDDASSDFEADFEEASALAEGYETESDESFADEGYNDSDEEYSDSDEEYSDSGEEYSNSDEEYSDMSDMSEDTELAEYGENVFPSESEFTMTVQSIFLDGEIPVTANPEAEADTALELSEDEIDVPRSYEVAAVPFYGRITDVSADGDIVTIQIDDESERINLLEADTNIIVSKESTVYIPAEALDYINGKYLFQDGFIPEVIPCKGRVLHVAGRHTVSIQLLKDNLMGDRKSLPNTKISLLVSTK